MRMTRRYEPLLLAALTACPASDDAAKATTQATPTTSAMGTQGGTAAPPTGATQAADESGDDGTPLALSFVEIAVEGDLALTTGFAFVPGTMDLLALSKSGQVDHLRIAGDEAERLGGFTLPGVYSDLDCGLLSVAFDPDYARNHFVYLGTCISQTHSAVYRVTFDGSDYESVAPSAAEIIRVGDDAAPKPWHNVGSLGFDVSGNLWALFGDKRISAHGQDTTNELSGLIRIIPNRDPDGSGHEPAPGNPFADVRGASPDLVAYGLRSPWRGVYDAQGRWWFGDVGANGFEEINIVSSPGQNFGWANHEGPCEASCDDVTEPVLSWPHEGTHQYQIDDPDVSPTNARVAWVGAEYTAATVDQYDGELTGTVLFGDYCLGFVRGATVNNAGEVTSDRPLGHLRFPTAWREGADGFLYVTTFGKCETAGLDEDDPPASGLFRVVAQ